MSSTTPYIGSKISLISKAEIRYEGILYGIDANESTVTLAKVTSFGTEDRNAPKRIPAGSEVYEYIIFRGSDIKDLHVKPAPTKHEVVADDPAIVSQSGPNVDQSVPVVNMPPPSSFQSIPLVTPSQYNHMPAEDQPSAALPELPPVSISPPAAATVAVTTTSDTFVSTDLSGVADTTSATVAGSQATHSVTSVITPFVTATNVTAAPTSVSTTASTTSDKVHKDKGARSNRGSAGQQAQQKPRSSTNTKAQPTGNQLSDGPRQSSRGRQQHHGNQSSAVTSANRRRQYPSQYYSRSGYDNYYYNDNYYAHSSNQRYYDQQGWGYQGSKGSRGGGWNQSSGQGSRQQSNTRGGQNKSTVATASKKPIKFDGDFDFEGSNAKFKKEQMEEEFKQKLKLDGRKDSDSDVQTQEEEDVIVDEVEDGEVVESTMSEPPAYYDSTKSFFDSISCEANKPSSDRRSMRSEEKSLNSETFGYNNPRGPRSRGRSRNYAGYQNQAGYYHYSGYQPGGRGGYRRGGQYNNASRSNNSRGRSRLTQEHS